MDRLQEEFTDYQLLERSEIPDVIWKEALIYEEGTEGSKKQYFRMDVIWAYLSGVKNADRSLRFQLLSSVARLVLVIPHSNAGEESFFRSSNKTKHPADQV